ncbi:MAG: hypothetical protein AAB134_05315, partial [Pseudomonadota bacterium]
MASSDAAWVAIPSSLPVSRLAELCRDVEAIFRVNPYWYFENWAQTGPATYHAELENQSIPQRGAIDFEVVPGPGEGYTVNYRHGIKKRTVFLIEPFEQGSRLTVTDDYERLPEPDRSVRIQEVDKSLSAWGEALRRYFMRHRRWSWLPGWRWYMRRVWVPMKPSSRRIVWLIYLISVAEF